MHLGWSSCVYPLVADDFAAVPDYDGAPIPAADLPEEPVKGDAVVWRGRIYEVLAPHGEPCWRWSDAYHVMKRVHTKETEEE